MKGFSRARIPAITAKQWDRAKSLVVKAGAVLEPAQLRSATGMKSTAAWSLLLGVFEERHAELFWLVHHNCVAHPVVKRRYEDGFQPVPWQCPDCEENIENADDLSYELQAVLIRPIEFV